LPCSSNRRGSKLGDENHRFDVRVGSSWRRPMRKGVLHMGILDELLAGGNARKSIAISLIDTNKDTRPRATPIKRFCSDTVKYHTPCRQTNTLRLRKRR
jgi:hypothetical protein